MQVLKLCKLAYKPRPHYCFKMIFSKCHILCRLSAISKQLKTTQLSFYIQMLHFIILNKILNNVKINEIILNLIFQKLK